MEIKGCAGWNDRFVAGWQACLRRRAVNVGRKRPLEHRFLPAAVVRVGPLAGGPQITAVILKEAPI
jgi:hypothetical protein